MLYLYVGSIVSGFSGSLWIMGDFGGFIAEYLRDFDYVFIYIMGVLQIDSFGFGEGELVIL